MSSSTNKLACAYSLIPHKNAAQITPAWSGPTVSFPVTTTHNLSALNKLWVNSIYESNITSLKSQTSSSINRANRGWHLKEGCGNASKVRLCSHLTRPLSLWLRADNLPSFFLHFSINRERLCYCLQWGKRVQ